MFPADVSTKKGHVDSKRFQVTFRVLFYYRDGCVQSQTFYFKSLYRIFYAHISGECIIIIISSHIFYIYFIVIYIATN